jgi:hypothetical protein
MSTILQYFSFLLWYLLLGGTEKMTEFFSGFITPLIAIITVSILVLRYFLAKRRWRLDLYDKRYPVFLATMEYISSIMPRMDVTQEALSNFLRNFKDREFLFGKDIQEYLDVLYDKGVDLSFVNKKLENESIEKERERLLDKRHNLFMWFKDQFEISKQLFGKYLKIDKK